MDKYKFGDFIYQRRKALGLTQDELGRKLGVTNKAVSKWEVGETTPEVAMLEPLAKALEVSVDELLTQKKKKKVKINSLLLGLVIGLGSLLIVTIVISSLFIYISTKPKEFLVDKDCFSEYVSLDPLMGFSYNDQELVVSYNYQLKEGYSIKKDDNIIFDIEFEIDYYYYLEDGSVGVITYYYLLEDQELNNEINYNQSKMILSPKKEIKEFKSFKSIEVNYTVLDCLGTVYH